MAKNQKMWTSDECKYIVDNYKNYTYKELGNYLGRTEESVKSKINKVLKLENKNISKDNLKPLLENTNGAWYWLGFIAGDGYLSENSVSITVHPEDCDHLGSLAILMNRTTTSTKHGYCCLTIGDGKNIEKLKSKIGYNNSAKTYNPLNIDYNISEDHMLSFIFGLFDADGCIEVRNDKMSQLKLECHASWYDNLLRIGEFLKLNLNIESKTIINKRGYVLFRITKHMNGVLLRKELKRLEIPYLKRKWDRFSDSNYNGNFFESVKEIVVEKYKNGQNLRSIAMELNVNYNSLYNHINEIKEEK